jgi:DNA-binding CsgD family transcriptional regulator
MFLSPREKQLLRRIGAGKTDQQIASKIGGNSRQIAEQRARLLTKLEITSRAEIDDAVRRLAPLSTYRGVN